MKANKPEDPPVFDGTRKGFCRRQHVSHQTYHNEVNGGRLRTYKIGRARRHTEEAEREWVAAREAETNAA